MAKLQDYPSMRVPNWFYVLIRKQIEDARLTGIHVPSQLEAVEDNISTWYRAYYLSTNTGEMPPWMPYMGKLPQFLAEGSLGKLDSSGQRIYNELIRQLSAKLLEITDPLGIGTSTDASG